MSNFSSLKPGFSENILDESSFKSTLNYAAAVCYVTHLSLNFFILNRRCTYIVGGRF